MSLKGYVYIPNGSVKDTVIEYGDSVTATVDRYPATPSSALVLIVEDSHLVGLGQLNSLKTFYTFQRAIRISEIETLPGHGIRVSIILRYMSGRTTDHARSRLENGGLIPNKTWVELQSVLKTLSQQAASYIERANSQTNPPDWFTNKMVAREIIEHERDAVGLALRIAGADHSRIRRWYPKVEPEPFLASLEHVELTEDHLIANDMRVFGEWEMQECNGLLSRFTAIDNSELTIINVNRHKLETTLGADLIYWNHNYMAFVIVQYKRMRPPSNTNQRPTYYPRSDRHLRRQIDRMQALKRVKPGPLASRDAYRLGQEFCFIKVCMPIQNYREPSLAKGKYFGIDLWNLMEKEAHDNDQPFAISMDSDVRYLTNTNVVDIVSRGWIGSHGLCTDVIGSYINDALTRGRSVTLAASSGREGFSSPHWRTQPT